MHHSYTTRRSFPHDQHRRHPAIDAVWVDVHPDVLLRLTPREHDVLCLLCQRLSDREIADRLYLSLRTIHSHVGSILSKLGVRTRRDAAAIAARLAPP